MLASIFMFLDLLDQKDAMQVCSSWFKIMENPTLNTMFKRDWERVVVEPHHFADQQRFLPYGDTLLLPWMNQAGVLFGKYVQYRDWADFGLRLDGEQNLILARSNDYILYKKPKKFPVLINLNHFRYGSWVPKIFLNQRPLRLPDLKTKMFALDKSRLYVLNTRSFTLDVYDLDKSLSVEKSISLFPDIKQVDISGYRCVQICLDENSIYIFNERYRLHSTPKVIIWCLDKTEFKRKHVYMFTEEHLQAGKLGDCYVHNGDVFYSFEVSDYLKMLVVRDMKSELAASSFVDSHVKATLWNDKVVLFDEQEKIFKVWNKVFTSCETFMMRYNSPVFDTCW